MIKFHRSAAIDFDIDMALESLVFVSIHFLINGQSYCCLWNASTLREMSASLIEGMAQGLKNLLFFCILYSFEKLVNLQSDQFL